MNLFQNIIIPRLIKKYQIKMKIIIMIQILKQSQKLKAKVKKVASKKKILF
jgi:hypothetical protein